MIKLIIILGLASVMSYVLAYALSQLTDLAPHNPSNHFADVVYGLITITAYVFMLLAIICLFCFAGAVVMGVIVAVQGGALMSLQVKRHLTKREKHLMRELVEVMQRLRKVAQPVRIDCPKCLCPHVDYDEWATRLHKTHLCEFCGHEWRPFNAYTVGVLPDYSTEV